MRGLVAGWAAIVVVGLVAGLAAGLVAGWATELEESSALRIVENVSISAEIEVPV